MSTIREQIELEKRMVAYGIVRYKNSVANAEEDKRSSEAKHSQALMREFIDPVSAGITSFLSDPVKPGPRNKSRSILSKVDPDVSAYFALKCLMNHFTQDTNIHRLANHIGTMIEDELKFSRFKDKHGEYYETIIQDFKRKGTTSYRHMHRVLTHKASEKNVLWGSWSSTDKITLGMKLLDIILSTTDLATKHTSRKGGITTVSIRPSAEALDWINNYHRYAELLNPDRMPCVIQPDEWTTITDGGYYTPQLRNRTPMVKSRIQKHKDMFNGDISFITNVINTIQNVPWEINKDVYDVLTQTWNLSLPIGLPQSEPYEIPVSPLGKKKKEDFSPDEKLLFDAWKSEARMMYTLEKERIAKCFQVIRVLKLATDFKDIEKFWYVYQCDFRGRVYATVSGLSPQGPDFAKSLLRFSEGKRLGDRGAYWLKVHGANCFGVDKVSFDNRVKWVEDNGNFINRVAEDPLSNRDFWASADKPWQFLAFCFEYSKYLIHGVETITRLPIGLDGSCNGLQNFSAMLLDPIGGRATNLTPQDIPSDIYSEVAKVCTGKLDDSKYGILWRDFANKNGGVLPRSLAKRPVMTLPYGSTIQSCREYIHKYMVEDAPDSFDKRERYLLASYLTPLLWTSISDVVVAARAAMNWLQVSASSIAKSNNSIIWWTPVGFPVLQSRKRISLKRVSTQLAGTYTLRIGTESDVLDVSKNKLAIAPNFVHSMDACHLMLTCSRASKYGVTSFAFIHDDYGTHACDIDKLALSIRESFIELYSDNDPLVDFKIFNADSSGIELTDPPTKGSLKLEQVLDSKYFFS